MGLINFSNYYSGVWCYVLRTLLTSVAVILSAWLLQGVHIESLWAAIGTAIVIGLLDNLVRPGIVVATLPFTMASMGCFLFVINAVIILLAGVIVPGFKVDGFWWAVLFSILLTVFNFLLEIPSKRLLTKRFDEEQPSRDRFFEEPRDDNHLDEYEDVTDQENNK